MTAKSASAVPALCSPFARQAKVVRGCQPRLREKAGRGDGRCPARTGDLLLERREQLLRSTAACRSLCSASDVWHLTPAVCCGVPLPDRFHVMASASAVTGSPAGAHGARPQPSTRQMPTLVVALRANRRLQAASWEAIRGKYAEGS